MKGVIEVVDHSKMQTVIVKSVSDINKLFKQAAPLPMGAKPEPPKESGCIFRT